MINVFLTDVLRILIISPILFFTIKNRKTETAKVILVFILFFMLNSFFLYLPISVPFFQIFGGGYGIGAVKFMQYYALFYFY
jgi:hypothetical protein